MPFQVVNNPPLQVIKRACEKLSKNNGSIYHHTGINLLGHHHTTHSFSIKADGNAELTLINESNNDSFPITVHMSLFSFHIDLKKSHEHYYLAHNENGVVRVHKEPGFLVTVGDLFKLFYKQNPSFFERKPEKKNKRREEIPDEETERRRAREEDEEEDRMHVTKLTAKALKVTMALIPDARDVLGALNTWKDSRLKLWTLLTKEGHLKNHNHKNDFTGFCSMLVALPIFRLDPREPIEAQLPNVATYELMKKLARYYLFAEDPEVHVNPVRDYFDRPKSLADICELYADEIPIYTVAKLKKGLTRTLNNYEKNMLDTKYFEDLVFDRISSVEDTYPAYALRTISLTSWCTAEDRDALQGLVGTAMEIAKSDKAKKTIQKRGKFQTYSTYEDYSGYRYRDYRVKNRKYNVILIRDEATIMDQSKDMKDTKADKFDNDD